MTNDEAMGRALALAQQAAAEGDVPVGAVIGRIVFGAWDAKLGACGSVWDIPRDPHIGHSPEVIGGIREKECAALLGEFFATRR